MSFQRPRPKQRVNAMSRCPGPDPNSLLKENQKLHSEIKDLENALQLHHDLQVKEDNTIQGILRKEIGGTRWQHGGSGKLKGYKSTSDLKEPLGLTPMAAAQRRRKAREQNMAHRPAVGAGGPSLGHQDDSSSADELPPDIPKYTDRRNRRYTPGSKRPRKTRSATNSKDSSVMLTSTSEGNIQGGLFPTDPLKIDDLKHKVLEKIGVGVIKRPSRHSAKSDNDVNPESHLKNEPSSSKPSTHRSTLSSKQHRQGYVNTSSEDADKNSVRLQRKHVSTKMSTIKTRKEPIQENLLVSENCDKENNINCPTEEIARVQTSREIPTSDYSSDVEHCPDKVEEFGPFSGLSSDTFSQINNESNVTTGKNASKQCSEYVSMKSHKCLSDDADDTPVLGIISLLPANSTSHSSKRNLPHVYNVKTKEQTKSDHAVEAWLRNIGLRNCDKYVEIFARHEIDMSGLKYLTTELLNQMGIMAVGPINKILMAILNLEETSQTLGSHTEILGSQTQTPVPHTQNNCSHTETSGSLLQIPGLMSGDTSNVIPHNSAAHRHFSHSPSLSPKVEECIPEFTSHLMKKYETLDVQNRKVNVASELHESDNVQENSLKDTYTIQSEMRRPKSTGLMTKRRSSESDNVEEKNLNVKNTFIIQPESRRPKSKTLMTKRSASASRVVADDKAVSKPRMQSRSANVSTARQRDILRAKKEGKKEKVQTSGEMSVTSRSNIPNRPVADVVQKKAEIGIYVAAHKIENRQKQEQDERNLQLKLMKKRKQKRDELAAKHQDRKIEVKQEAESATSSSRPLSIAALATHDLMSSTESDEAPIKIVLTNKQSQDMSPEPARDLMIEGRPRPSTAMPRSERKLDDLLTTEEKSLSARERLKHVDLTVFKSQTNIHQRLTLDMVKDLQKQLEEIEKEITNTDGSSEISSDVEPQKPDPVKSTHLNLLKLSSERTPALGDGAQQKDQTTRGSKNTGDGKKVDHSSGSVMTISRSKRALLDEIRKEKDEHRKQIRHLQSELSRLQYKDPVRKSELDAKDIIFNDKDIIGEGAFSQVFRGSFQAAEVAVKRLKVPLSSQDRNYFAAEVSLLRELHHPRIVMLIGVCTSRKLPIMVLDYLSKGNLFAILHDSTREMFDHAEYYQIARDIASGMTYLHNHRPAVLHLDLKSMNVLIGIGNRAKIADFGFSKLKHEANVKAAKADKGRQIQGSPAWMAPEMVQGGEVTVKTDVYSFAIILWEMLTRQVPYEHCSTFQILEKVRHGNRPSIPSDCPQELSEFIQKCWDSQPSRRPTFKDVLVSLENLSFPPDWRALFQQAGVPSEALENLQSTRNIISLVTSTLESSKLQKIIDDSQSTDHVESSVSITDETEESAEHSNGDEPEGKLRLSLDEMSDDSLENISTNKPLDVEMPVVSRPTPVPVTLESEDQKRSEQMKPSQKNYLEPPSVSGPRSKTSMLSPRLNEGKKDATTSPRKSFEAWTEENIDRSDEKTDVCSIPAAPPPPPPPPPLPPTSSGVERKQLKSPEKVKSADKVKSQTKSKVTGQMLKEKSLGLKKLVAKTKDVKRNGVKVKQSDKPVHNGSFVLAASELQKQRGKLKSTTCPHPNQLQDLNMVSKKDLYSIAEILKHAMSERRFAMGEVRTSVDTDVSQSQAELSWSTQDD